MSEADLSLRTKKERLMMSREQERLERDLGGIKDMGNLPSLLFVIDTNKEANAIKEARSLGIPVIAIVDTNCDPDTVDYAIRAMTTPAVRWSFTSRWWPVQPLTALGAPRAPWVPTSAPVPTLRPKICRPKTKRASTKRRLYVLSRGECETLSPEAFRGPAGRTELIGSMRARRVRREVNPWKSLLQWSKPLRESTGVGMMDCKKALAETNGDLEAAVDWLRTRGLAKAAKKADRVAAEVSSVSRPAGPRRCRRGQLRNRLRGP